MYSLFCVKHTVERKIRCNSSEYQYIKSMKIFFQRYWVFIWGILLIVFLILTRSFPFWTSPIPLWYDPWLYKSMFLAYMDLETIDFSMLAPWIQHMYEPFLWLWWKVGIALVLWGWHDSLLTRGWVFIALLPVLWMWLVAHRFWTRAWLFAVLLAVTSFTQYQIFWWQYRKQAVGMFLLLVVLWWWERKERWKMIPILIALFLVNRPAAVLIACVGVMYCGILLVRRDRKQMRWFGWSVLIAYVFALPVLYPLLKTQIVPLFALFLQHINVPTLNDWFQAWGTFLTIREYLFLAWIFLLPAFWWIKILQKKQFSWTVLLITLFVLTIRVFWQWFFFQRMIGYLDMIVIIFAWITLASMREWKIRKKIIVCAFILYQCGMLFFRWYRTYRPLIEPNEFAFIAQIGNTISSNAVIVVPGIDYSPRVQWWTQHEVLAPWLFDLNRWWNLDEQWNTKRLTATAQEKCDRLRQDYPEIMDRPVYVWQWLKQPQTDLQWACFQLIQSKAWRSRWKLTF